MWGVGEWEGFRVASEAEKYRLTIGGRMYGRNMALYDPVTFNGMKFTTKDDDNDGDERWNQASKCQGGWWHHKEDSFVKRYPYACLNCQRRTWFDPDERKLSESRMSIRKIYPPEL